MNLRNTIEAIRVMQAWVDNEEVEMKMKQPYGGWSDIPTRLNPDWNWSEYDYRIKPKPVEIEIWINPSGDIRTHETHNMDPDYKKKRFMEVME